MIMRAGSAGAAGQTRTVQPARPAVPAPCARRVAPHAFAVRVIGALVLTAALAPTCATTASQRLSSAEAASLDRLLTLIAARLEVAPDVARAKWNSHAPIEDLPREAQVIATVGRSASEYRLPRADAERFFRAQIDASKVVQRAMIEEFTRSAQPPFATVKSLETEIRPVLDRLTPALLREYGAAFSMLSRADVRRALERRSHRVAPQVPGGDAAMAVAVSALTGNLDDRGQVR